MLTGSTMRIAGVMNNAGLWSTVADGATTVEYNGSNQTVVVPNPATNRYSTLILSGSGFKTLPSVALIFNGNFSVTGTASTIALNDMEIAGNLTIGSNASFNIDNHKLDLRGNLTLNGMLDAHEGYVYLEGTSAQTINGTASNTIFKNLYIQNPAGVTSNKNLTVNSILDLSLQNPSTTKGSLEMASTFELNMGADATTVGIGDVTGIVKREHAFLNGVEYSFGNQFTSLNFLNVPGNIKPTWVKCKITIGTAPSWRSQAIRRYYSFAQSGGTDRVIAKLHYLDSELHGAETDESQLVFWDAYDPAFGVNNFVLLYPRNKNGVDISNNWVQLTGPAINYLATSTLLDVKQWGLSYTNVAVHTWTGAGSPTYDGDWSLPGNWNGGVPQANNAVLIPHPADLPVDNNGDLHPYRNLLPIIAPAQAKSVEIATGATLSATDYDITVYGDANAWVNNGNFIAGTAEVIFANGNLAYIATIAGTKTFLSTSIAGDFIISGSATPDLTTNATTISMNGTSPQTISGTVPPTFNNLTINSTGGVISASNITVNGALSLQSTNPAATQGCLHMGSNTLTMGAAATTTGIGDVTGIVKRTSFVAGTAYTFGNQFTTLVLSSGGTLPSEISVKITIGAAPSWKPEAITRNYDIISTGGNNISVTAMLHYLDSELNFNTEADLKVWNYEVGITKTNEIGKTDQNTTDNWVRINNLPIASFSSGFNNYFWTLSGNVVVVIEGNKGWRMIASPTATTYSDLLGGFVTQGMTGSTYPLRQPNFLWFDETEILTTNMSWRKPAALADNIKPGRGYYFYVFGDLPGEDEYNDVLPRALSVTGASNFNSGSFSFSGSNHPVTFTPRTGGQSGSSGTFYDTNFADEGWSLVGNPGTQTINWDAPGWTKTRVDNAIYIWDPSANSGNGDWKSWNGFTGTLGNGLISPFQAFWVKANAASPALSFTDAVLTTGGSFLKSEEIDPWSPAIKVVLEAAGLKANMFISFTEQAVEGPDPWDAYYLESLNNSWVELYSFSSPLHSGPLTINNLPAPGQKLLNLPVFVDGLKNGKPLSGDYTISWELPANWPADWTVTLLDNKSKKAISMKEQQNYRFNHISENQVSTKSGNIDLLALTEIPVKKVINANSLKSGKPLQAPFNIVIQKGKTDQPAGFIEPNPTIMMSYPNPFGSNLTIRFSLPQTEEMTISIYDILGRKLEEIIRGNYLAGIHEIYWQKSGMSPGIYLLELKTQEYRHLLKINHQ